jgi:hypothetical protein
MESIMSKSVISLIAMIAVVFSVRASGSVYTTGVALNFASGTGSITAWTQPNLSGDGAILSIAIDNNLVLSPTGFSAGIGHVWYSVAPGTAIDPAFAASAPQFANSFTNNLSGQIQLSLNQTFLLGFWLDANGNGVAGAGDRFGWASFTYNASGLNLNGSAIENTGAGIIAGTTTVVPEPATISLCLFALIAFCVASRRAISREIQNKARLSRGFYLRLGRLRHSDV